MAKRLPQFPKVVGVRLSVEDAQKLTVLAYQFRRSPSEVLRLLIRTAQPTDIPPVVFGPPVGAAQGQ